MKDKQIQTLAQVILKAGTNLRYEQCQELASVLWHRGYKQPIEIPDLSKETKSTVNSSKSTENSSNTINAVLSRLEAYADNTRTVSVLFRRKYKMYSALLDELVMKLKEEFDGKN